MNDVIYEHRQFGWAIVGAMLACVAVVAALGGIKANGEASPLTFVVIVLLLVGTLFWSMTVRVTASDVSWWFGRTRTFGKTVAIAEIASVEPIRTSLIEGWGVHLTWHGWLWNVAGFNAVQITLKSGSRYAVGTPEPESVVKAIKRARKANR